MHISCAMATSKQPADEQPRRHSTAKQSYLILYNLASAIAWLVVLGRVVAIMATARDVSPVAAAVAESTKWTQTAAWMEVLHAAAGIVRSPLPTTFIQVFSRNFIVWAIVDQFPTLGRNPAYTSMLLAWSVTEVIRYSYFTVALASAAAASTGTTAGEKSRVLLLLMWLRYNTFFVLYPVGIFSEWWLVLNAATGPAGLEVGPWYEYLLKVILAAYVPASYIMYTHMMAQRRKVMRGAKNEKKAQ